MAFHTRHAVRQVEETWSQLTTIQIVVVGFGLSLLSILLSLRQLLRPVDKLPAPRGKRWKLPPGPRGWPIVGNLFLYFKGEAAAHEIARYGEMTTTHIGSKLWVVLNTNRLVQELYARKGAVTNGRPPYPVVSDMISQGRRSVLLPPETWSERRRVMHQLLSGTAMTRYQDYQDEESLVLLKAYLDRPDHWYRHNYLYSNTVIHRITFGEKPEENEKIAAVTQAQFYFLMNAPPLNLWDNFPELARLPKFMQWWRKKYEALGRFTHDTYNAYWEPIRGKIEAGKAPPSFARDVIVGNEGRFNGSDADKMFLAMQLIEAGSDTTRLAVNIFILAAVTHPEAFLKARTELDAICGGEAERLPTFDDEEKTPYVNACIKELLRWRRIFVWSPEHTLTQDLEFEGYLFPKGTNFVVNHTSISENPEYYKDPQRYMPERWLDGNESDILGGSWQFGAGRRVCVGYRLAQRSLFILVSRLVYCFDFKMRESFDDKKINHFTLDEPYPVQPSVRSKKHEDLLRRSG